MYSLHIHSNYSMLSGSTTIEDIISTIKKDGGRSICLTDINGMYGLIKLAKISNDENIKPIFGTMITEKNDKNLYALFLAKNLEGYRELGKIITARKIKEDFSLSDSITFASENLFIIIRSSKLLKSIKLNERIKQNIFVELILTEGQKEYTRQLYKYASKNGLQIIASQPLYFLRKEDYRTHKVLRAMKNKTTLENLSHEEFADEEYYYIGRENFKEKWSKLPEALWNLEFVIQNCNVDLAIGKYKYPEFPLPKNESAFSLLWKFAFKGLSERYHPITDKAVKRLQYELEVIDDLGFCDYFLIVGDIIRETRRRKLMSIGRGSAANSLVSYCLGFTQVDPLAHNLYFERFLNRGRTSPPDVDLDFSWRERDSIIKYVFEKYGYDHVAMISTHVTFRARSAFRETAKVFGVSNSEISKFSKYIPWTSAGNLDKLSKKFPESKSLKLDGEPWISIINIAAKIGGFPRHLSIHPGGIVITKRKITDYVALEYAANKGLGLIVTQPDMYSIEDFGLIKIDLLSQRSLGVMRDTLGLILQNNAH